MLAEDDTPVHMDLNLLVMPDKRVRGARSYTHDEARAALDLIAGARDAGALVATTVELPDLLAATAAGTFETMLGGCLATIVQPPIVPVPERRWR